MPAFRITVAYDGTGFVGWQRQAAGASIQGVLEEALSALDGAAVTVTGAGRTDAGVHALGQVASFQLARDIAPDALARALNARLPDAVRVLTAAAAPDDFNARFAVRAKTYRYLIWNGGVLPPFVRRFAWHVPGRLDAAAMDAAARLLEGRHDFAAFQSTGSGVATTEREVVRSRVRIAPDEGLGTVAAGQLVAYEVTGSGFLRHMVRAIAGSLVEVGRGRRDPAWLRGVLAGGARGLAGPTAPPQGLFLVSVDYNRNLERGRVHVA